MFLNVFSAPTRPVSSPLFDWLPGAWSLPRSNKSAPQVEWLVEGTRLELTLHYLGLVRSLVPIQEMDERHRGMFVVARETCQDLPRLFQLASFLQEKGIAYADMRMRQVPAFGDRERVLVAPDLLIQIRHAQREGWSDSAS